MSTPIIPSTRLPAFALSLVIASVASVSALFGAGCGSGASDASSGLVLTPTTITKTLSGRYEPVTSAEGAPTAEFAGMSSIWFSGTGDYQIILANCSANCEELGKYSIDDANVLTLTSFANDVHQFHIDDLMLANSTNDVHLQNTGSGPGTGTGSSGDNQCSATSDGVGDDSSDDSSGDSAGASTTCTPPDNTAGNMGLTPQKSSKQIGDGKSSSGTSGVKRTGGAEGNPSPSHSQTVTLLYLGSPAFLTKCAPGKYGCGASYSTYAESDLYFSAPLNTVTCGGKAKFCKGSTCVTAVRVESSDSHQHFEGSNGLIKALGDTPVDPASGCSGGSGSIDNVVVSW